MGPGPYIYGTGPTKFTKKYKTLYEMVCRKRYWAQTLSTWSEIVVRCFLKGSQGPKRPWEDKKLRKTLKISKICQKYIKNTSNIFPIYSLYNSLYNYLYIPRIHPVHMCHISTQNGAQRDSSGPWDAGSTGGCDVRLPKGP